MSRNQIQNQIESLIQAINVDDTLQYIQIAIKKSASETLWKKVELWTNFPNPSEWAAIGIGRLGIIRDEVDTEQIIAYIEDFIDLPTYNIDRSNQLQFSLQDVLKINAKWIPLIMVHTHNSDNLEFSIHDKINALLVDYTLKRPLIHIVINKHKQMNKKIYSKCYNCEDNPFLEKKPNGGK